jgi:hypothetical protein
MKKTNIFKMAALTAVFAVAGMFANAQVTTGPDIPLQSAAVLGQDSGYVKVIDNKGTVKFLQSRNGITMFTNTTPSGGVITTWQLGGTLADNTYIDVDGKVFALDGIPLVDTATLQASTNATTLSDHGTGTGWTILVRNEATGATMKMLASDLLKVQSGQQVYTATAGLVTYTLTGITLPSYKSVYVYRNGAKLIANEDYTIAGDVVTLVPGSNYTIYAGDRIEVHYIK